MQRRQVKAIEKSEIILSLTMTLVSMANLYYAYVAN